MMTLVLILMYLTFILFSPIFLNDCCVIIINTTVRTLVTTEPLGKDQMLLL